MNGIWSEGDAVSVNVSKNVDSMAYALWLLSTVAYSMMIKALLSVLMFFISSHV